MPGHWEDGGGVTSLKGLNASSRGEKRYQGPACCAGIRMIVVSFTVSEKLTCAMFSWSDDSWMQSKRIVMIVVIKLLHPLSDCTYSSLVKDTDEQAAEKRSYCTTFSCIYRYDLNTNWGILIEKPEVRDTENLPVLSRLLFMRRCRVQSSSSYISTCSLPPSLPT